MFVNRVVVPSACFIAGVFFVIACSGAVDVAGIDAGSHDEPAHGGRLGGSQPVINEPLRVITADTDEEQLLGGVTNGGRFLEGPAVITDLDSMPRDGQSVGRVRIYVVPDHSSCHGNTDEHGTTDAVAMIQIRDGLTAAPVHGVRIFVPAGYKACMPNAGGVDVTWTAFLPYQKGTSR
jgi:hypothetical protein